VKIDNEKCFTLKTAMENFFGSYKFDIDRWPPITVSNDENPSSIAISDRKLFKKWWLAFKKNPTLIYCITEKTIIINKTT
jgi:hypothetical protein